MSSRRTRMLFWFSAFPALFAVGTVAWAMIYSLYLTRAGRATYFVVFHPHWLRLLVISVLLFLCGSISLVFDRQKNGTK